jgi:hypothetical protein
MPARDREVAELILLLPCDQAAALERVARQQRLTVAQLLRQLIRNFLACPSGPGR